MNIGLGLPVTDPTALLDWARRADAGPFSTLGLLDRLVYDNPEPRVALAVIAGATTRVRVQTEVLLAPLREAALLAFLVGRRGALSSSQRYRHFCIVNLATGQGEPRTSRLTRWGSERSSTVSNHVRRPSGTG